MIPMILEVKRKEISINLSEIIEGKKNVVTELYDESQLLS